MFVPSHPKYYRTIIPWYRSVNVVNLKCCTTNSLQSHKLVLRSLIAIYCMTANYSELPCGLRAGEVGVQVCSLVFVLHIFPLLGRSISSSSIPCTLLLCKIVKLCMVVWSVSQVVKLLLLTCTIQVYSLVEDSLLCFLLS